MAEANRRSDQRADLNAAADTARRIRSARDAFLLAAVIGSGVMAQRLSGGNDALALLCNTLPTGAMLTVLILIFRPTSGAHLNPAVSLASWLRRELLWPIASIYLVAQLCGAVIGVWAAHLMFELPVWQFATHIERIQVNGSPRPLRRSACCLRYSVAWRAPQLRRPMRWAFTLQRPIGSPPRPHSPIRPLRLHVRFPILLPALLPPA
jgi:Major intrinsic protein